MNKFIESLKFTFLYDLIFSAVQLLQLPTSHLVKQKAVKNYAKKYGIKTFIETGTYLGTMVKAVKNSFKKIYTIELDDKLYHHAASKFKNLKHIKILHGDSAKVLPKVLKNINESCLFWLDAHYSKGITAKGSKNTPIREELAAILRHKIKNHVILIDDAESFSGENDDYPSVKFLKKYIKKSFPNFFFEVKDNIIRITPKH